MALLATELEQLNARRQKLIQQIRLAAARLMAGENPLPFGSTTDGPEHPGGRKPRAGRRKGFKMSAEARAKISAAQKKRWAKHKRKTKGYEAGNG